MSQHRYTFSKFVPKWLSVDEGEKVLHSLGVLRDWARERVRLGLYARFPTYAPPDALSALGRDRKLIRGIDEPSAAYAARLVRWLDDHKIRGNPFALLEQLHAYLQTDTMLRTVDRRGNWYTRSATGTHSVTMASGNWQWDTDALSSWSRFWVIIYSADGSPWEIPTDFQTYGTISATEEQIASVKRLIREWKPAGTRCEWIIVSFDTTDFQPEMSPGDAGFPDSDWRYYSHMDGLDRRPVRNTNARYWAGPGNSTT